MLYRHAIFTSFLSSQFLLSPPAASFSPREGGEILLETPLFINWTPTLVVSKIDTIGRQLREGLLDLTWQSSASVRHFKPIWWRGNLPLFITSRRLFNRRSNPVGSINTITYYLTFLLSSPRRRGTSSQIDGII